MKQLTNAQKQHLDAKIKQERQKELREKSPNPPQDSKSTSIVTRFTSSYLWKYGFLGIILCFIAFNAFILIRWWGFESENNYIQPQSYMGLMLALMLLFNHIAGFLTTKGWKSIVMKIAASVWIAFVLVYFFSIN